MSLLRRTAVGKAVWLECAVPAEIPSRVSAAHPLILMFCSSLENRRGRGVPSRSVS